MIQPGDMGQEVLTLQRDLMKLGYLEVKRVNAIYDAWTAIAVCKFQAVHKLSITGIADEGTLKRLGEDLRRKG